MFAGAAEMSRPPSVRIANDCVSESVDLLQMLITPPPPPPPPPPPSVSRAAAVPRQPAVDAGVAAAAAAASRPRVEQPCYQACHACAEERRYRQQQQQQRHHHQQQRHQRQRQQQQQQQAVECAYCACPRPHVDPRADRNDVYFNPRGPPGSGPVWPRRPPPVRVPGTAVEEIGGDNTSGSLGQVGLSVGGRGERA